MKIVIDVPESVIEHIKDGSFGARIKDRATLVDAVMNGTPFPNNATNGDVIKAIFPDAENIRVDNGLPLNFVLEFELHRNYKNWWNSPYKAGDTDGNS